MFVSKRLSVIFGEFKTVVIGYFTIVDYKDKLILALSDNVNQKLPSKLMMINPKTKVVEKETVLNDKQFIPVLVQVYDNKVYVLNHDEKIKELDENLNIIRTYSLQSDTKSLERTKGFRIYKYMVISYTSYTKI